MSKIVDIDLGTTNSCVAVTEDDKSVVIPNSEGARTTPSVVALTKTDERLVGEPAERQAVTNTDRTIVSTKCHMDTDYKVTIDGKGYTPQEISVMVLQKLKADAESYLGEKVSEAVITVPAYFSNAQRQTVKDVDKIAGLEVKRTISEPTAMALVYGLDSDKKQKIMVYDLSGGTFDVSIIDIDEGVIEVLATNGDTHLGGDDFDDKITKWMIAKLKKQVGMDLGGDKVALQRLKEAAEKTKRELSTATTTEINLPFVTAAVEGPQHLTVAPTRAKFDELMADLIGRMVIPMQSAMRDAGITNTDLGKVLLVGDSAHMLNAQEKVKQLIDMEPSKTLNPDKCVAIGTTIQGDKLAGDSSANDVLLLDVIPLSLSIETMGGIATKLTERNTAIPTRKSQVFSTAKDNQSAVSIHVVQGERGFARDNKSLGQFRLDGILPTKRDVLQIEATFDVDANGIMNVSIRDLGTDKEQYITVISSSDMSQEDTDKVVKEASEFKAQDKKKKETIDERNNTDSLIFQTEKAIQEVGEKLSGGDEAAVKADLNTLKKAVNRIPAESMTNEQVTGIKADKEKLMTSTQQLFQRIYENAQQSQTGRGAADNGGSKPDDGVVDGDFKEVQRKRMVRGSETLTCPFEEGSR